MSGNKENRIETNNKENKWNLKLVVSVLQKINKVNRPLEKLTKKKRATHSHYLMPQCCIKPYHPGNIHGEVPQVGLSSCFVFASLAVCRMGAQIEKLG